MRRRTQYLLPRSALTYAEDVVQQRMPRMEHTRQVDDQSAVEFDVIHSTAAAILQLCRVIAVRIQIQCADSSAVSVFMYVGEQDNLKVIDFGEILLVDNTCEWGLIFYSPVHADPVRVIKFTLPVLD